MAGLKRIDGVRLGWIGLVLAAMLFLCVNIVANTAFRGWQIDLTDSQLYTLSDGTRRTLAALDEPITLRLYFSDNLGQAAPQYAAHYARVRELLQRYVDLAAGKIDLQILDPEPFSDAEDRAVADGMQGVPVSTAGDLGYFGLAGTNSTDGREVIPFFNLEREPFVEYDLTKLVYSLVGTERTKLGLLSGLPAPGGPQGFGGQSREPLILTQLEDFFDVERLDQQTAAIPEDMDVILVIAPSRLSEDTLHAVDAFVHAGGRALVFVDPNLESVPPNAGSAADADAKAALEVLLRTWGVQVEPGKIAGDLNAARRVSTGAGGGDVGDYVAWLSLGAWAFEADNPIFANVERINLASAGILNAVEGATTSIQPLLSTSADAMAIDVANVQGIPDVQALLRDFRSTGKPFTLAARIVGPAPLAFPATLDNEEQLKAEQTQTDQGNQNSEAVDAAGRDTPIDVIVVADIDILYDRFWVTSAGFFGQQVLIPNANNADFVINALENLSGSEALIGLRGRGTSFRPFTLIEGYRKDAERKFRAKEQELQGRLHELENQIESIRGGDGETAGEILLTPEAKQTIERFRGEILGVRRQLRDVQHALRRDIDSTERIVKFINIGLVPIAVCVVAMIIALIRRSRRARLRSVPKLS
ncbi:MAG: Gldg family protein [Hyphomicrobiales bacterium]|nr:Gldg family protein [Hyphomicrobiales bacterium]